MAIVVQHDKRRREILDKALDVFMDEGFEDATFQKIADRCGITRTTLYVYFENKKEVFKYSLKQFLGNIERDIVEIYRNNSMKCIDKINTVMSDIIDRFDENRRLLTVVMDYLLYIGKTGSDPWKRVRQRTVKLRHFLATILIEGIRSGEISNVNIRMADEALYALIESAIFRLAVLRRNNVEDLKTAAGEMVRQWGAF
jgi:AcrR family transcriptional regulator